MAGKYKGWSNRITYLVNEEFRGDFYNIAEREYMKEEGCLSVHDLIDAFSDHVFEEIDFNNLHPLVQDLLEELDDIDWFELGDYYLNEICD